MKPAFCRDAGFSSRPDYGRVEMSGTSELYRVAIKRRHSTIAAQVVSSLTRRRRPASSRSLASAHRSAFRKQQRDAGAQHCTRARDETDLRNGDFVLFHLSFPSFNRNANPPQMGSGRKPSAAASGSRGAVSFSSARTAKRFPSRCASSDVVKDEQCGLSIHTLRNCLDPRHRFLLDPYRGGGVQVCKTKMSISMWSAPSGVERRRDTSKLATCSRKKTSKVVAVLR